MSALGCESPLYEDRHHQNWRGFARRWNLYQTELRAQATTTVTTTKGAFTEYVPGSETMVVRTETSSAPLRYVVSKQTTIVDESGAPVAIERISPGSPLSIQYTGTGEQLVASRIVVQKPAAVTTEPVTTAPVATQQERPRPRHAL